MTDPMTEIMSADDKVDALPDIGVMDLFVRSKLMKAMMEKHSGSPTGWETDSFRKGENALMNHTQDGVRTWALSEPRLAEWVHETARENRAEDFTVTVFDRLTTDGWSDDRTINAARGWLKRHLSGSLGMPDDRVIRENLKNYDGDA